MLDPRQLVPDFVRLAAHPLRWRLLATLADGDRRVRELVALIGEPQSALSYHLRLLREGGLVRATRSTHDGRDSYYHLDLDRCGALLGGVGAALHPALGPGGSAAGPASALFVCTGNSARSAMAEALATWRSGGRIAALSAGTRPKPEMHPNTVRVLREEFGIDIAGQLPRDLGTVADRKFDVVVTLCDKAREICPDFGVDARHWSIPDPGAAAGSAADTYPIFRSVAAEIDTRVRQLLPTLGLVAEVSLTAADIAGPMETDNTIGSARHEE